MQERPKQRTPVCRSRSSSALAGQLLVGLHTENKRDSGLKLGLPLRQISGSGHPHEMLSRPALGRVRRSFPPGASGPKTVALRLLSRLGTDHRP